MDRLIPKIVMAIVVVGSFLESARTESPEMEASMRARVDALILARLEREKSSPGPLVDDLGFARRAYLDLLGRIPRVSEIRDFQSSASPTRREELIASLLEAPEYAIHMANIWRRVLLPEGTDFERFGGIAGFETWLRDQFANHRPYDQIVRDLLLAEGSPADSGPQLFYAAWELKPEKLAASTSRTFLGIQLQCAECHDHPFDTWSQRDFWGYAAFFSRLQPATANAPFPNMSAEFVEHKDGEIHLPNSEEIVPARHLASKLPLDETTAQKSRRALLADWITAPDNPYFARATVNRVWSQLFGRGLVEPADDMREKNPPSHPELLEELAHYFQQSHYDLRALARVLTTSDAYQRSSERGETEIIVPAPANLFAYMAVKSLTEEQLYDSLTVAIARIQPAQLGGATFGLNRILDPGRQEFLRKLRTPNQNRQEFTSGIPQALSMMNGSITGEAIDPAKSDIIMSLSAPFFTDAERIEGMFLAAVSRAPREEERSRVEEYLAGYPEGEERQKGLGDVLWALINSAEFALNH
jgi:Protein of unknown function (DUF1553)/Protein of unknown function (DUF1549)